MLLCTKSFYWSKRCEGTNRCKGEANCTWSTGAIGQVFLLCLLQFFEGKSVLVCEEGHLMTSCQGSSTYCRVQVYTGNEGWWSSTPLQALLWQHRKVEKEPWQPWREKKSALYLKRLKARWFSCVLSMQGSPVQDRIFRHQWSSLPPSVQLLIDRIQPERCFLLKAQTTLPYDELWLSHVALVHVLITSL